MLLRRSGILFRREKLLQIKNIHSCEITMTPLERWLGLATLSVRTAGSRLRLQGLTLREAQSLQKQLVEKRGPE